MAVKDLDDILKLARAEQDRDLFALRQIAAEETDLEEELNALGQLSDIRSVPGCDPAFYGQGEETWALWLQHRRSDINNRLMILRAHKEMALTSAHQSTGRADAAASLQSQQRFAATQKMQKSEFEMAFNMGLLSTAPGQ